MCIRDSNVVLPIAGVILTFIACYELIEIITQHNNMAQFEPALLMKDVYKRQAFILRQVPYAQRSLLFKRNRPMVRA